MNLDKLLTLADDLHRLDAEYRQTAEQARRHRADAARLRAECVVDLDSPAAQLMALPASDLAQIPVDELDTARIPVHVIRQIIAAHSAADRAEAARNVLSQRLQDARTLHERCLNFARQKGARL